MIYTLVLPSLYKKLANFCKNAVPYNFGSAKLVHPLTVLFTKTGISFLVRVLFT